MDAKNKVRIRLELPNVTCPPHLLGGTPKLKPPIPMILNIVLFTNYMIPHQLVTQHRLVFAKVPFSSSLEFPNTFFIY